MKILVAITSIACSVSAAFLSNHTIVEVETCDQNWNCSSNPVTIGCCNGICTEYTDETHCADTNNRPLTAFCTENSQCGDSCCSLSASICVAPLLDCKHQLPLWAFATIITVIFIGLLICYKLADRMEKKQKKIKREKKEDQHYVDANSADQSKSKSSASKKSQVSTSNVSKRNNKSPSHNAEEKLGDMDDNRISAHFNTIDTKTQELLLQYKEVE